MPTIQNSAFDRGFDVRHYDRKPPGGSVLGREHDSGAASPRSVKRYLAMAVVAIMVVSAFVVISPSILKSPKDVGAPDDDKTARIELGGARNITYQIYDIGESYLKPMDYTKLGRHDHSKSGINTWFPLRNNAYNDTVIHGTYPYVVSYDPYSGNLKGGVPKYDKARWSTHSFYTLKMDAENITSIATGTGAGAADPWMLPIMGAGGSTMAGGWVNMSMYFTYLTTVEYDDIHFGNHYANTFYGVTPTAFAAWYGPPKYDDDGWLMEAQGVFDFNVNAAKKFLGLPGNTGNLINEFNAKGAAAIATQWSAEWIADGDTDMPLDTYANYDYHIYSGNGPVFIVVKLDTDNSSANKLVVRFWSLTWGGEALYTHYLWQVGITEELQPYMEDWYLNGTFAPTMGDIHSKMTTDYHITMWKDPDYFIGSWMFQPQNMDYTFLDSAYVSYFNDYYCGALGNSYKPLTRCWTPGQEFYGQEVHFWVSPMNWNLDPYESLSIKLPVNRPGWVEQPYWGNNFTLPGNSALEQASNGYWGEWVLGHGRPTAEIYKLANYTPATKTLFWQGPKTFARWPDEGTAPTYPATVNEYGTPFVVMDISRVSQYKLTLKDNPSPIYAGQQYVLQVQPLNFTGVQAYSNQTVGLPAVAGVTYGATTHKFVWNETIWNTTVTFSNPSQTYNLKSNDTYFFLDIDNTYAFVVGALIPEFPTLLIPVIGAAAIFVVLRRRKTSV